MQLERRVLEYAVEVLVRLYMRWHFFNKTITRQDHLVENLTANLFVFHQFRPEILHTYTIYDQSQSLFEFSVCKIGLS
jgi:hypothetical protein